jgi:hypothetical protein
MEWWLCLPRTGRRDHPRRVIPGVCDKQRETAAPVNETWIVLVEAARNGASSAIHRDDLGKLLGALDCGSSAGGLHSPDRYAFQLTTTGCDPSEALRSVLLRWANAVCQLKLPAWEIVRTEVLSPKELRLDLQTIDATEWVLAEAGAQENAARAAPEDESASTSG